MPAAMRVGFWFAVVLSVALAAAFFLTAAQVLPYKIAGYTVTREAWWRVSPILQWGQVFTNHHGGPLSPTGLDTSRERSGKWRPDPR
jgi:hypothetical protein